MKERLQPRQCEAPEHHPSCDGIGSTRDHFTPRCIGKLLGWDKKKINSPDNIQWLSPACHIAKDRDTPLRKEVLKMQLKEGYSFNFEAHQAIFNGEVSVKEIRMQEGKVYHLHRPSPEHQLSESLTQPIQHSQEPDELPLQDPQFPQ